MRHEYCEKNGIIITYSDSDVAFEERETALSILISNNGSILHKNKRSAPALPGAVEQRTDFLPSI